MSARDLEEVLLHWLPLAVRRARSRWEAQFLADMARRAHWRNWRPTAKQERQLRRICAELFEPSPDLIDREG